MKKFLCILALLTYSGELSAQVGGKHNPTMETVQYSLPVLAVVDSTFLVGLDSVLQKSCDPDVNNNGYKYFRVSIKPIENGTDFFVELSKYSGRKRNTTAGCFTYNNRIFIVSGNIPEGMFDKTAETKSFSYRDYVQPSIFSLEDDIPTWIFQIKNGRIYSEHPNYQ